MQVREKRLSDRYRFDGALRLLDVADYGWVSAWEDGAECTLQGLEIFAADAFGTLYGVNIKDTVSIVWTETGDVEDLGIAERDFYALNCRRPELHDQSFFLY